MTTSSSNRSAQSVRLSSPAKVNLFLEVHGRRPDGFHELDTLMLTLDLGDELRVEFSDQPGVQLELSGPAASEDIPTDERNLASRAAKFLLDDAIERGLADPGRGLLLTLEKKIPSRAGLGGGSSNAAAACLGAAHLLGNHWDQEQLSTCLGSLGSDCAFFVNAAATGFARCQGRGEIVSALGVFDSDWHFVVIAPSLAISTPEVFAALGRGLSAECAPPSVHENLFFCPESEARLGLFNRLEAAALEAVPALGVWRDLLDENDAQHFLLSGTGSTYYGMYRSREEAEASLVRIRDAAGSRELPLRGSWVARPNGRGVHILPDE
ncbi:MAG: 4-diphosphocytidyl-2-C-methyl-D-erythritol kinase [Planctomycetota bacterium]|jgi:4-diphosphocytidyl-2-C-methyl-D-erythritol kinase